MQGTSTREGSQPHHRHPRVDDNGGGGEHPVLPPLSCPSEEAPSHCTCGTSPGTTSLTHFIPVPGPVSTSTESKTVSWLEATEMERRSDDHIPYSMDK